jgi:hypothetical protein
MWLAAAVESNTYSVSHTVISSRKGISGANTGKDWQQIR